MAGRYQVAQNRLYSIWSIWSCVQYMDFVESFNVSVDLSTIYVARFSGCWASFVSSCYFILACYNTSSGVKSSISLSIRSFCFIPKFKHSCITLESAKPKIQKCEYDCKCKSHDTIFRIVYSKWSCTFHWYASAIGVSSCKLISGKTCNRWLM